jgi:hypothetical protein
MHGEAQVSFGWEFVLRESPPEILLTLERLFDTITPLILSFRIAGG